MELKDRLESGLYEALNAEFVRLEEDDRITGFVVSREFRDVPTFDRQTRIEQLLKDLIPDPDQRRRVLMIAAVTPEEYDSVGPRIRVQLEEGSKGTIKLSLQGIPSDAEYVRRAFSSRKGVRTTEPRRIKSPFGRVMMFRAKGTPEHPLTKEKALRILKKDSYIEVTPNA